MTLPRRPFRRRTAVTWHSLSTAAASSHTGAVASACLPRSSFSLSGGSRRAPAVPGRGVRYSRVAGTLTGELL
jgi:hypothetical protein